MGRLKFQQLLCRGRRRRLACFRGKGDRHHWRLHQNVFGFVNSKCEIAESGLNDVPRCSGPPCLHGRRAFMVRYASRRLAGDARLLTMSSQRQNRRCTRTMNSVFMERVRDGAPPTAVVARLDRAIQYSSAICDQSRSRGVLGRPVKPGDDNCL